MEKQKRYANLRVMYQDIKTLKIVAALSRESMLQTFSRLVAQEYGRIQQQQEENMSSA